MLIVPPAGLVGNWRRELLNLFRLDFRIVGGADVRTENPFHGADGDRVIVSLDTLAGDRMFDVLRQAGSGYDLVVFDEAHKLSVHERGDRVVRTRRYELAEALAVGAGPEGRFSGLGWTARNLLLLTATPHMGKSVPYALLWRLLDADAFGAVEAVRRAARSTRARHFLRRTKEEMTRLDGRPLYPPRTCDTFSDRLSGGENGEQSLYERTARRSRLARSSRDSADGGVEELEAVRADQKRLATERQLALARIEEQPRRILPGGYRFLLHALVVRPEDAGAAASAERYDGPVEELAVRIAADRERARGATVQDVSKLALARAAGLPDWPGFDLLSTLPNGEERCIEVKGRASRAGVRIESNEWAQACKLRNVYWLYVVLDCAGAEPELLRIRDPFRKLLASKRTRARFDLPLGLLIQAAEARGTRVAGSRATREPGLTSVDGRPDGT